MYNDLSGDEVKHILSDRFSNLLNEVPYLQKHITLPRVKMRLSIELVCWADQGAGENRTISDEVEVRTESFALSSVIDASTKGDPPDKVREEFGLGIPTPRRGPVAIEDTVEGRKMTMANGAVVDRTGESNEAARNATVVKQDFGPARSRRENVPVVTGNQERDRVVVSPNFDRVRRGED